MKVVINKCYGGFSLSPRAVKRLAELNGRECYFFKSSFDPNDPTATKYTPLTLAQAQADRLFFSAFDIPNPEEVIGPMTRDANGLFRTYNLRYAEHALDNIPSKRDDPKLIQVVEELGGGHRTGASGQCADLEIVEIPDGIDYEIEEYDGMEHVAESHRTWG
jgi:hypothetical protein